MKGEKAIKGEISWQIQNSFLISFWGPITVILGTEVDNKLFKRTERKCLSLAILWRHSIVLNHSEVSTEFWRPHGLVSNRTELEIAKIGSSAYVFYIPNRLFSKKDFI